jgi:competence protein ComEC
LFLLTNFVVVPLSSLILFAELALLLCSVVPAVAHVVSSITTGMLRFMNNFIERLNQLPFAVTDGIQNSIVETLLLYVVIVAFCHWLYENYKPSLFIGLIATLLFVSIKSYYSFQHERQHKVIVYNIPKLQGIDFIEGKQYLFAGDTVLMQDGFLKNFHIQPSRILHHVHAGGQFSNLSIAYPFVHFHGKRLLLIDHAFSFQAQQKVPIDVIVLSKNARVYISQLAAAFDCRQYVFDGSNSLWKINQWKKDCDNLHLPHYSTPDKGAFEWKL